jgi:sensor c-di-GMP phosphodiesterase-like protein
MSGPAWHPSLPPAGRARSTSGIPSLSYLGELPINALKMDKSFVDGIAVSGQRLALAEGIVHLARTLQPDVVAEGIESEASGT